MQLPSKNYLFNPKKQIQGVGKKTEYIWNNTLPLLE